MINPPPSTIERGFPCAPWRSATNAWPCAAFHLRPWHLSCTRPYRAPFGHMRSIYQKHACGCASPFRAVTTVASFGRMWCTLVLASRQLPSCRAALHDVLFVTISTMISSSTAGEPQMARMSAVYFTASLYSSVYSPASKARTVRHRFVVWVMSAPSALHLGNPDLQRQSPVHPQTFGHILRERPFIKSVSISHKLEEPITQECVGHGFSSVKFRPLSSAEYTGIPASVWKTRL